MQCATSSGSHLPASRCDSRMALMWCPLWMLQPLSHRLGHDSLHDLLAYRLRLRDGDTDVGDDGATYGRAAVLLRRVTRQPMRGRAMRLMQSHNPCGTQGECGHRRGPFYPLPSSS